MYPCLPRDPTARLNSPIETLGIVRQVPIKIRDIETYMDMIVTESREYNVLLGNTWLKYVKANIDYKNNTIGIEYQGLKQTIPVTCTQKLDPKQFTLIDPQEELELEDEDEDPETLRFHRSILDDNQFAIEDENIILHSWSIAL